jgi:hypothetical protein
VRLPGTFYRALISFYSPTKVRRGLQPDLLSGSTLPQVLLRSL